MPWYVCRVCENKTHLIDRYGCNFMCRRCFIDKSVKDIINNYFGKSTVVNVQLTNMSQTAIKKIMRLCKKHGKTHNQKVLPHRYNDDYDDDVSDEYSICYDRECEHCIKHYKKKVTNYLVGFTIYPAKV